MEKLVKRFIVEDDKVIPELDLFLEKAGWIQKSAATKVSEFQIYVGTFKTTGSYKYNTYGFSMNEIEAEFDYNNGDMLTLTLRDTSVNKKYEINTFLDKQKNATMHDLFTKLCANVCRRSWKICNKVLQKNIHAPQNVMTGLSIRSNAFFLQSSGRKRCRMRAEKPWKSVSEPGKISRTTPPASIASGLISAMGC